MACNKIGPPSELLRTINSQIGLGSQGHLCVSTFLLDKEPYLVTWVGVEKRQRALQEYGRTGELRDRLSDWRFDGWAGCRTHGETDKLTSMDVCIDEQLDH